MHLDTDLVFRQYRLLLEADLTPVQGSRFQPTGFPDLGAAVFQRPDGKRMLLVESAQSMANRLENTITRPDGEVIEELAGMPYVRVLLTGDANAKTTSLKEAHRINSPFIIGNDTFKAMFREVTGYAKGKAIDWSSVARGVFRIDPNSLIHGVFMANFEDGRIRFQRALSAFVEAEEVREAASGGVKNNPIDPTGTLRTAGMEKDVYGNVPYHRMEYTAQLIRAYFNIDLSLLKSYELPEAGRNFLLLLSLFKIRRLLEAGLRFRTACDLRLACPLRVTQPEGVSVPGAEELLEDAVSMLRQCTDEKLFADPPVTELRTDTKRV